MKDLVAGDDTTTLTLYGSPEFSTLILFPKVGLTFLVFAFWAPFLTIASFFLHQLFAGLIVCTAVAALRQGIPSVVSLTCEWLLSPFWRSPCIRG